MTSQIEAPIPHMFDIHTMPLSIDQQILQTLQRIEVLLTTRFDGDADRPPVVKSTAPAPIPAKAGKFGRK